MISLKEYITEKNQEKITLPYTFDLYNEGAKNKDFYITKRSIYFTYFKINNLSSVDKNGGFIKLPVVGDKIEYKEFPSKENTDNWTKVPEIHEYSYAGAFYSDKVVEYNKKKYDRDWEEWLRSLKPYMSGKISVTLYSENGQLFMKVNDKKFNDDRKAKLDELNDISNVKKIGDEISKKEKEEMEKEAKRIEKIEQEKEEYKKFLNSMSEKERKEYLLNKAIKGSSDDNWTGD